MSNDIESIELTYKNGSEKETNRESPALYVILLDATSKTYLMERGGMILLIQMQEQEQFLKEK